MIKNICWFLITKIFWDQIITIMTANKCFWLHRVLAPNGVVSAADSKASPFYQNLPDCTGGGHISIKKKTSSKALLCPMIRYGFFLILKYPL
jgi:hypothetical protein